MNYLTINDKSLRESATLHMPMQAAPINRTVSRAALAATLGVAADQLMVDDDDDLDDVL